MAEKKKKIAVRKNSDVGYDIKKKHTAKKASAEKYSYEDDMEYPEQTDAMAEHMVYNDAFDDPEDAEEFEEGEIITEGEKKMGSRSKKKKRRKKLTRQQKLLRGMAIAICTIAVLALIVIVGGWIIISHYYNMTNYLPDDEVTLIDPSQLAEMGADDDEGIYMRQDITDENGNVIDSTYMNVNLDELSPEELESIRASIAQQMEDISQQQNQAAQIPIAASDHVYNLLLIGVDLRAGQNWYGNSDSVILISINTNTHKIYMTSFMRDLYTNIPGAGVDKLNRAHALGGGPLLVQAIEENFRINIDNYATVNFYSLISIIDALGGINMDVSAEEASVANSYIADMCSGIGVSPDSYYISGGGTLHLNGMQAVAYARIRYVGNADFGRTERQRKVLAQMFATLQSNPGQVNSFLNTVLPLVTHNIPQDTVTTLILNAPTYLGYTLESYRVPFDGLYTYAGEMLVPDFNTTISTLQGIIYQ